MKILYFDCFAGISGDMILAALADLGLNISWLNQQLKTIPLEGITLSTNSTRRGALTGTKIEISVNDDYAQHDAHAHGHGRGLRDFVNLLEHSPFPHEIKSSAIRIFSRIAQAEAKVHKEDIENIHFHELGSLDSLIDILGTLLGLKELGIERIISSPLNLGTGFINTQHGTIPVPSPATIELLTNIPVYSTGLPYELVTPTGAAIISTISSDFGPLPMFRPQKIGYGAGSRDIGQIPNLLRVIMGTTTPDWQTEQIYLLETDIDDMNPQYYDYLISQLLAKGALDVSLTPIIMKKNRPATRVTVLSPPLLIDELSAFIFKETSTLGLRIKETWRKTVEREIISVPSFCGSPVRVKIGKLDGKIINISPEYEDCREIALKTNRPIKEIYQEAYQSASKRNEP